MRNIADLDRAAAAGLATLYPQRLKILVGSASCGVAMGARTSRRPPPRRRGTRAGRRRLPHGLHRLLRAGAAAGSRAPERAAGQLRQHDPGEDARVARRLCPSGDLRPELGPGPLHERRASFRPAKSIRIRPAPDALQQVPEWSDLDFYRRQKKVILRNCGSIDPMALDETIARGTYRGALRAMTQMTPEAVIDEVIAVRAARPGRGGLSHRAEMAAGPAGRGRRQVRGLQRRRRRARGLHGPDRPGGRSARHPRRDAHRLLRDRRQRGVHLRPQRVSAGHRDPRTRHRPGREARPVGRRHPRHAAGRSTSRSAAGRGPTSAAKRPP